MIRNTPFVIPLLRQATSTSTFTIKTVPWNVGDIIVLDAISAMNEDTPNKKVIVGIIRNEFPMYFATIYLTSKGYYYMINPAAYIPSGYRIIVKVINPGDGDKIHVNIFGHLECPD